MKKLLTVCMCFVFLCACGDTGESEYEEFVLGVGSGAVSFTAELRAEYSDKTVEFTLSYTEEDDAAVVEIKAPESVAGIRASVSDALTLEYDGAILDVGTLTDAGLSPMSALPLVLQAIRGGHVELTWTEEGKIAARLVPSDGCAVTLWLDGGLTPVSAEISQGDETLVFIDISDWQIADKTE